VRCGLALKIGDPERASELIRSSIASFEAQGDRCGRAMASFRLSELAEARGDYDEAVSAATLAYEATLVYGGRAFNTSTSATRLGNLAALQGRFDDAATWHADALTRAREGAYPGALAQALGGIAHAAYLQGRLDDAEEGHREALAVYESAESVEGVASTLVALGFIAAARGDHHTASDLHLRSLSEASRGSDRRATALAIEGLAGARAAGGDGREAAVLLGAAAEIRRDSGAPLLTTPASGVSSTLERVRALVDAQELEAARREGAARAEEIVEQLLTVPTVDSPGSPSPLWRSGLDEIEEVDDQDVVRELREVRRT
jgi:tetratricopeptide (TPR) repeat protein